MKALYYIPEVFKPVEDFDGYEIGNLGRLHILKRKGAKERYTYGYLNDGYLWKKFINTPKSLHRIVYKTFVGPIPEGYDVHHKNHIRTDNRVENLELIEMHEHRKFHNEKTSKPVIQYTKSMELVQEYSSIMEAERQTGISQSQISKCASNRDGYKTAGGYIWKYKNNK